MENLFYFLNITVSVKCETAIHPTAVVACFLKIYHTLQYSDILRIYFFYCRVLCNLPRDFGCAIARRVEMLLNTSKKFITMLLQLQKVQCYRKTCEMFIFRGITPGNFWCIVCHNKIVRKVSLKVGWCNSTKNINLLAEMTLVYSTDLLTRSCRLILYGSVGLTISKISSWEKKTL